MAERRRCELCGRRLYSDESQLQHEFSGRCLGRSDPETSGSFAARRFVSDYSVAASKVKRNPRSWGAGLKKGGTRTTAEPPHGTRSRRTSKKWGPCACELCLEADARYARERRANTPPRPQVVPQ